MTDCGCVELRRIDVVTDRPEDIETKKYICAICADLPNATLAVWEMTKAPDFQSPESATLSVA